jgi:hypothetical protein
LKAKWRKSDKQSKRAIWSTRKNVIHTILRF